MMSFLEPEIRIKGTRDSGFLGCPNNTSRCLSMTQSKRPQIHIPCFIEHLRINCGMFCTISTQEDFILGS